MDEETGRRVCSLIAGVLCADEQMSPAERDFLKKVLERCGLETDTALMPTIASDVAEEFALLPEEVRWETLDLVIKAAAVDGTIKPAERAIVDVVAAELGVDKQTVIERFRRALPPE